MKKLILFLMSAVSLFAVFGYAAAQSGNTWLVMFYNNTVLQGNPVYTVSTNTINYYWGTSSPGPSVLADNFSARMTTNAYLAGGEYRFHVAADGGVVLSIDGVDYIDTWSTPQAGKSLMVAVPLEQGNHSIEIDYRHISGPAFISVIWSMTGQPDPAVTVTPYPQPTSVNRISTNYGNYTSCIQQNLHQAAVFNRTGAGIRLI